MGLPYRIPQGTDLYRGVISLILPSIRISDLTTLSLDLLCSFSYLFCWIEIQEVCILALSFPSDLLTTPEVV